MMNSYVDIGKYVSAYAHEFAGFYVYVFLGFLVPFTLGHPQFVVGPVVNAILVLSALEVRTFKLIVPLIVAPTLGVLARGILFGPLTPYVLVMMPFIWAGNSILVFGIMKMYRKKELNFGIGLAISSLAKAGFLFAVAFSFVSLAILPPPFLEVMGIFQLWTAIVGGVLAFGIHKSGLSRYLLKGLQKSI